LSAKVAVIGDIDTTTGFALAGAQYVHVHIDRSGTLSRLGELLEDKGIGLVLITHSIAEELGTEFRRLIRKKELLPIVLRIPDKTGYTPKEDELYNLIKRTVGAEIVVRAGGG
jgi:V/A-type H+-transporting ATPase subunit F